MKSTLGLTSPADEEEDDDGDDDDDYGDVDDAAVDEP